MDPSPLAPFSAPVREWFATSFPAPTHAQAAAWPVIAAGDHTLLCAPTGSGKTLAAFLWAIDRLGREPSAASGVVPGVRVLYVSPLRALAVDVEKNLASPLRGIELAAQRLDERFVAPTIGVRTGDTSARERRALSRTPPDVLITTPESLFLMLTSAARETLAGVQSVIIDEIHALAPTKRGAHLALSLERLDRVVGASGSARVQRIGLSATQRPLEVVAGFLGGSRPVTIVDSSTPKELDLSVVVPVEDMSQPGGPTGSIWPSMHPELLQLIRAHRSTLVFVNSRRLAERLASQLNDLDDGDDELVKAHHGSLSRERRLLIENQLKRGELRALVATSSLELGIDMGAVDLVVQIASPGSVSSGLQRIGRAGHQVGAPSRGRIFPKHRADLLEAAVVVARMRQGLIEHTVVPASPLDVLAQQIVAACALDEWSVDDLYELCRGAANYSQLSREQFDNTLDLLAGRYPSDEFSELRPRVVWDRVQGTVRGRAGAQRLAVTSGGTIPDRGLFGVFLPDGTRVGELDEEMVYESRAGETFLLGASTWRIEDITFERVVVTPAPGQPGKMPFWRGGGPGREAELGRALGEFVRKLRSLPRPDAMVKLRDEHALDELAASNVLDYLDEQADATGVVSDDRTIVVERFRDEIGDWRICIHSPFGARVHAPWATILRARLEEQQAEVLWSDDGIVLRLPEAVEDLPIEVLVPDPDEVEAEVVAALPGTATFAARFREAAARALLLPRRRPGQRTPLWQQRQRAADLLSVAARYPAFPMLLEATRECCNDEFDLPALRALLTDVRRRRTRVVAVETPSASPFARSLLFGWIAVFMYEGDAPLAERRAAALSLDRELLRDLLGAEELRSLPDPVVLDQIELELQHLVEGRTARDADELHDLMRVLGPLSTDELRARTSPGAVTYLDTWLDELTGRRRAIAVAVGGDRRYAAAEDAARLRDALGVAIPVGLPSVFTDPVDSPLRDLVSRHARTHGPFTVNQVATRFGAAPDAVRTVLGELVAVGRVAEGQFRPDGSGTEWVDTDVLRQLRRRSLAALRDEVAPVDSAALTRFLAGWQGVGSTRRGVDALVEAVSVLQGAAIPASVLEPDVLAQRMADYRPSMLDELCVAGDLVWIGSGSIGANDGRVRLLFRDQVAALVNAPPPPDESGLGDGHHAVLRSHLSRRGASFWADLVAAVAEAELPYDDESVLSALWDLVWAGEVTNDSLAPLRSLVAGGSKRGASGARSRRPGGATSRRLGRVSPTGPPAAAGRWSSTAQLFTPGVSATEAMTRRALQLVDRYGVLTREMALAEGAEGGFAGVYPMLKLLEERGQLRRGYFVDGLGAAQFAQAGAVDLLRVAGDDRHEPAVSVLAATDPAQPYGAALAWPASVGHPARAAGAYVVLVDGHASAYLERGGRRLLTFPAASDQTLWTSAFAELVSTARLRRLRIERIDDDSAAGSPWADALRSVGFVDGYKGLSLGT